MEQAEIVLPDPLPFVMDMVKDAATPAEALAKLREDWDPDPTKVGPRCTGGCCKVFFLPFKEARIPDVASGAFFRDPEASIIADMIIPIADTLDKLPAELHELVAFYDEKTTDIDRMGEIGAFYTCKHFDAEAGNCRIYDRRPRMCRAFPNDGVCKYTGCTTACTPEHRRSEACDKVVKLCAEVSAQLTALTVKPLD